MASPATQPAAEQQPNEPSSLSSEDSGVVNAGDGRISGANGENATNDNDAAGQQLPQEEPQPVVRETTIDTADPDSPALCNVPEQTDVITTAAAENDGRGKPTDSEEGAGDEAKSDQLHANVNVVVTEQEHDKCDDKQYDDDESLKEEDEEESSGEQSSPQQYFDVLEETIEAATAAVMREIHTGAWRCWDTSSTVHRRKKDAKDEDYDERQIKIDRESCVLQAVERFASEVMLPYFQLAADQIGVSRSDDQVIMDEETRDRVYVGALLMLRELLVMNMRPIFCAGWYHNYEGYGDLKDLHGSSDLAACEEFLGNSKHEKSFSANILATGVILSATQKIEKDDRERILTKLTDAMASYEGRDDSFARFHHPTDAGLFECVSYDGKKLGSSHDIAWAVSYNRQFEQHPLASSSKSMMNNSASPNAVIVYLTDRLQPCKISLDEAGQKDKCQQTKSADSRTFAKATINEEGRSEDPKQCIPSPSKKLKLPGEGSQGTVNPKKLSTKAVGDKLNVKEIDIDIISIT